jgi:hypothetical protein
MLKVGTKDSGINVQMQQWTAEKTGVKTFAKATD